MPPNKCRRDYDIRILHFNQHNNKQFRREHYREAGSESWTGAGYLLVPKYLPIKILINDKGKKRTLSWRHLGAILPYPSE